MKISVFKAFKLRKMGLVMPDIFSRLVYGFMGAGSLCRAFLRGFLQVAGRPRENILLSSRSPGRLKKTAKSFAVEPVSGNEELVRRAKVIFLCMKPQDLLTALEPLAGDLSEDHTVISFPAGVPLSALRKALPYVKRLVRVVPNTAVSVGGGLLAYSLLREDPGLKSFVEGLFSPLGKVLKMEEEHLSAFTVAGGSGPAFVLELMQYWNEWLEDRHFSPETARQISTQTFLGTALLSKAFPDLSLAQLQSQVASKNGMTAEGLKAFNTAQLDSLLHYGFEKTAMREKTLFPNPSDQ